MTLSANFSTVVLPYGNNPAPTVTQTFIDQTVALASAALSYWGTLIAPSATFNITLVFVDIPGNNIMASAGSAYVALTQPSGSNPGLYEHAAGFALRHNVSLGLNFDFFINIDVPLFQQAYYDPDLSTSNDIQGKDAYSTLVHEIGHGLGFLPPNFGAAATTATDNHILLFDYIPYFIGENMTLHYAAARSKPGIETDYSASNPSSSGGHYLTLSGQPTEPDYGPMREGGAPPGQRAVVNSMELAWLADLGIGTINNDILRGVEAELYNDEVIDGGAGDDLIYGSGGSGVYNSEYLIGGSGIDTVDYSGSPAVVAVDLADAIGVSGHANGDAYSGIENVRGSSFNDLLWGDAVNNRLAGGPGSDYIEGGGGADVFVFDVAVDASINVDFIGDFSSGIDKLELSSSIYSALSIGVLSSSAFGTGTTATTSSQRILHDQATGALYYDPDGVGGAAAVQFAILGNSATVAASDFMIV